jgi:hypothetical protein
VNEVAELELPTQENFRTDLRTLFQGAIRVALEVVLEDEIREMVGAGCGSGTRSGWTAGTARTCAGSSPRWARSTSRSGQVPISL